MVLVMIDFISCIILVVMFANGDYIWGDDDGYDSCDDDGDD